MTCRRYKLILSLFVPLTGIKAYFVKHITVTITSRFLNYQKRENAYVMSVYKLNIL